MIDVIRILHFHKKDLIEILEDPTFWGKVDDFGIIFDLLDWIRYGVFIYLLLLTKTCYYLNF